MGRSIRYSFVIIGCIIAIAIGLLIAKLSQPGGAPVAAPVPTGLVNN